MANLSERLDQIEQALDHEHDQTIICIQLVDTQADLHEMPERAEDWLIFPRLVAEAKTPPYGPKSILLDPKNERKARAEVAARN
jgi:hypothetical protein